MQRNLKKSTDSTFDKSCKKNNRSFKIPNIFLMIKVNT